MVGTERSQRSELPDAHSALSTHWLYFSDPPLIMHAGEMARMIDQLLAQGYVSHNVSSVTWPHVNHGLLTYSNLIYYLSISLCQEKGVLAVEYII